MIRFGAHLSKQQNILGTLEEAKARGCTVLQFFPHTPYSYFPTKGEISTAMYEAFGKKAQELGITVVFHSSFYINLASPKPNIYAVSKKSLVEDLRLAESCGVSYVVTHIGSHTKDLSFEAGASRVVKALDYIIKASGVKNTKPMRKSLTASCGLVLSLLFLVPHTEHLQYHLGVLAPRISTCSKRTEDLPQCLHINPTDIVIFPPKQVLLH